MKALRKNLLAIAVVAGLGLSTVAIASPWGGFGPMGGGFGSMGGGCPMMSGGDGPMMGDQRGMGPRQHRAMMQQYHAERMELLAARLKLQPAQEAAWKEFLAAQDAHHQARFKAMREMRRDRDETAQAHFEGRVQFMEQNLASMKALTKAAGDLYATLDPTQKQVMDKFFTERPAWQGRGRGQGRGLTANPAQPGDAADAPAPADDNDE